MLRKSLLFISIASITALIAWGLTKGDAKTASASAAPAETRATQITSELPPDATPACAFARSAQNRTLLPAPSGGNPCVIQAEVDPPILEGTAANPTRVTANWRVTNVPTCYRIKSVVTTFTLTRTNAPNVVRTAFTQVATSGSASVGLTFLGTNLPTAERITSITASTRVEAEPEDPIKARTFTNNTTIR